MFKVPNYTQPPRPTQKKPYFTSVIFGEIGHLPQYLDFTTKNSEALLHSKVIRIFTNCSYIQHSPYFISKSKLKPTETSVLKTQFWVFFKLTSVLISFCQKIKGQSLIPQSPCDQSVNIFLPIYSCQGDLSVFVCIVCL